MAITEINIARQLYNTGGITNLINTYQNNPTLQNQMTQQEYVDLFNSQPTSTNTTEQIIQSSTAPTIEAPVIRPLLPIIPQQGGDGGGGITSIDREGLRSADDYGLGVDNQTGMGYQLTEEDLKNIDDARLMSGIKSLGYDVKQLFKNLPTAKALKSGKDFALDLIQKAKDAARARELAKLQEAARAAGFQGDTRTQSEQDFASSQTYGGGGSRGDMGADTFI
jgi:hypothetical protein